MLYICFVKQLKLNKMNPHESFEKEVKEIDSKEQLHEDICDLNTYISLIQTEIKNLDELIKGHKTYSDDVNHQLKLTQLSQRLEDNLSKLEKSKQKIYDFIDSHID